VKVTEKAVQKLKEYRPNPTDVLLVSILGGGCAGYSYDMEWKNGEYVYDKKLYENTDIGVIVVTNGRSFFFLEEAELDFTDGLNGKGFEWTNPMAKKSCGCGNSFGI